MSWAFLEFVFDQCYYNANIWASFPLVEFACPPSKLNPERISFDVDQQISSISSITYSTWTKVSNLAPLTWAIDVGRDILSKSWEKHSKKKVARE